jgi:hypothetical protein
MSEDLTKAERRWRNRALFRPQRRRRGRLLFLLLTAAALALAMAARWNELRDWAQAALGGGF